MILNRRKLPPMCCVTTGALWDTTWPIISVFVFTELQSNKSLVPLHFLLQTMLHHDSQLEHFFIKFSWLNCQSIILIWSVSSVCGSFHLCSNADQSWFISVHPQIRMTFSVLWNVVFPVHFLTLVKCYVLWMLGYIVPCALQWTGIFLGCIAAPRRGTIAMLVQRGMCLAQSTACLSWYFSHYIWWSHTHIQ